MTDDLIERLAREAGLSVEVSPGTIAPGWYATGHGSEFHRFAALVAEECAKECEARGRSYREAKAPGWHEVDHEAAQNAYAIRAKFKEPTNG